MTFGTAVGEGFNNGEIVKLTIADLGPGDGLWIYSTATPQAGTLQFSLTEAAGQDAAENYYLAGQASYAAGFANAMIGGAVLFYTGSLAGGWTLRGQLLIDSGGDFLVDFNNMIVTGNMTVDGNLTVDGTALGGQTGPPDGTGFFNTQGLASGSYGSTHQHTLPDFPTATHVHDI
jgi:hypothetical protein